MFIVIVESHDLLLQSPIFPREVPLLHRHNLPHLHCKRQIRDFVQQKLHAIERGNLKSDEKNVSVHPYQEVTSSPVDFLVQLKLGVITSWRTCHQPPG